MAFFSSVIAIAGGVLLCKRRKFRKKITVTKTSRCQFDNPVYSSFENLPKVSEKSDDLSVDGSRSHTRGNGLKSDGRDAACEGCT